MARVVTSVLPYAVAIAATVAVLLLGGCGDDRDRDSAATPRPVTSEGLQPTAGATPPLLEAEP